jgi:hypothetical protein
LESAIGHQVSLLIREMDFLEGFLFQLERSCIRNQPFILLGDFNDMCSFWKSDHADGEIGLSLYNLLKSFRNLSQLISEPTRGNNILDLLITN